jgi:CheY-like chemotaxis protein
MDDKMPKLSGVQTVENIEQIDGFNSKVILLTNATGTELESKLKNKNIVGALKKPINKEELNKLLKEILQNKGDK